MSEPEGHASLLQLVELGRRPPPRYRKMLGARSQVLAQRDDVDTHGPQVGKRRQYLVFPLPHAEDDARFGGQAGRCGTGQHGQTAGVACRWTHRPLKLRDNRYASRHLKAAAQ